MHGYACMNMHFFINKEYPSICKSYKHTSINFIPHTKYFTTSCKYSGSCTKVMYK